jgi:hypothetical protein
LIKTSTHFLPPDTTGNRQTPENRTVQQTKHGNINIHVCDDETWRFDRIKKHIDSGRYDNLPPVDFEVWKKHKEKLARAKNYKNRNSKKDTNSNAE